AKLLLAKLLLNRRTDNTLKESIGLLEQAAGIEPYNLKVLNVLARVYARAGLASLAENTSRRARAAFRDKQRIMVLESKRGEQYLEPGIHAELAILYARTAQRDKALFERKTVVALKKNPREVSAELQKFRSDLAAVHLDSKS